MSRLFVYGSLLEGLSHHRRLEGAKLLRYARTSPAYTLVSLGRFPGLVEGGATRVAGEVYEVDDATLAALDVFEGAPHLYERVPVRLERGARAEGYVLRAERAEGYPVVPSGDWRVHGRARPDGASRRRR